MTIYIDENISPYLARALDILEQREPDSKRCSVKSIQDGFSKGFKDPTLIPKMGKQNAVWITKDKHLLKRKAELKLILDYKIGVFILSPYWSKVKHWKQVIMIISLWQEIKILSNIDQCFQISND